MECDQMRCIFQHILCCTPLLPSELKCLDPIGQKSHQQQISRRKRGIQNMGFVIPPHQNILATENLNTITVRTHVKDAVYGFRPALLVVGCVAFDTCTFGESMI